MRTAVFFRGRNIGEIQGYEYISYRSYKHFFRKFNGFAISDKVLESLGRRGVWKITIVYMGKNNKRLILQSKLRQWISSKDVYFDGDDMQRVLDINSMEIMRNDLERDDPILKHIRAEKPLSEFVCLSQSR